MLTQTLEGGAKVTEYDADPTRPPARGESRIGRNARVDDAFGTLARSAILYDDAMTGVCEWR